MDLFKRKSSRVDFFESKTRDASEQIASAFVPRLLSGDPLPLQENIRDIPAQIPLDSFAVRVSDLALGKLVAFEHTSELARSTTIRPVPTEHGATFILDRVEQL